MCPLRRRLQCLTGHSYWLCLQGSVSSHNSPTTRLLTDPWRHRRRWGYNYSVTTFLEVIAQLKWAALLWCRCVCGSVCLDCTCGTYSYLSGLSKTGQVTLSVMRATLAPPSVIHSILLAVLSSRVRLNQSETGRDNMALGTVVLCIFIHSSFLLNGL